MVKCETISCHVFVQNPRQYLIYELSTLVNPDLVNSNYPLFKHHSLGAKGFLSKCLLLVCFCHFSFFEFLLFCPSNTAFLKNGIIIVNQCWIWSFVGSNVIKCMGVILSCMQCGGIRSNSLLSYLGDFEVIFDTSCTRDQLKLWISHNSRMQNSNMRSDIPIVLQQSILASPFPVRSFVPHFKNIT